MHYLTLTFLTAFSLPNGETHWEQKHFQEMIGLSQEVCELRAEFVHTRWQGEGLLIEGQVYREILDGKTSQALITDCQTNIQLEETFIDKVNGGVEL